MRAYAGRAEKATNTAGAAAVALAEFVTACAAELRPQQAQALAYAVTLLHALADVAAATDGRATEAASWARLSTCAANLATAARTAGNEATAKHERGG